jgi:hypothetical protein
MHDKHDGKEPMQAHHGSVHEHIVHEKSQHAHHMSHAKAMHEHGHKKHHSKGY